MLEQKPPITETNTLLRWLSDRGSWLCWRADQHQLQAGSDTQRAVGVQQRHSLLALGSEKDSRVGLSTCSEGSWHKPQIWPKTQTHRPNNGANPKPG